MSTPSSLSLSTVSIHILTIFIISVVHCFGGHVEEFGGLNTYIAGSSHSKHAIFLASDVYGYEAPNLRKIADKAAAAGYLVLVPDFLYGDPLDPNSTATSKEAWLKVHDPVKVAEAAIPVIEALKCQGVSKIGAAGFCWGGKLVVELVQHPCLDATVLLHPSYVTLDDIQGVKVPMSILGAEFDGKLPPELLKQFDDALAENKVDHFVKIYPGVKHGWTVKYNSSDPEAVKRAAEAHKDMLHWFAKYLR